MNNLYIHSSPKPITPFSLYTTEKPEVEDYQHIDNQGVKALNLKQWTMAEEWRKHSHLTYLQEPEWKTRQQVYDKNGRKVRITSINNENIVHYHYIDDPQRYSISLDIFKQFNSHYYPGQEIDPSKVSYVREVVREGDIFIINEHDDEWEAKVVHSNQWNRLEFNSFKNPVTDVSLQDALGKFNDRCRVINRNPTWQPAPEPEKPEQDAMLSVHDSVDTAFYELEYSRILNQWEKAHAQWLTDRSEGKVQATVKLNI